MIAAGDPQSLTVKIGTPLREVEKFYILRTLEAAQGNKPAAAKMLGVTLKTLYNRLHKYGYGKQNRYGKDQGVKANFSPGA
jgi:DNA-binding NtrC family response regulator